MPWKCPVCGSMNPDDVDRCLVCGAPKPEEGEAVEVPQPPTEVKPPEEAVAEAAAPAAVEGAERVEEAKPEEAPAAAAEEAPEKPEAVIAGEEVAEAPAGEAAPQAQEEAEAPAVPREGVETAEVEKAKPVEEAAEELPPPLPEGARVYLKVINSPAPELRGMRVPLQFDVFKKISVGRGPENVIIAPDPSVSRRHAVLYLEEGRLVIEDLGSTNGTYIYDQDTGVFKKIQKAYLKPGDLVRLGEATIFQVEVET